MLAANYSAEYGRSSNRQIRMVTRSGGREFHFAAYDYFRNDVLDANSWANNRNNHPKQTRRFNQFGYNFGGPAFIPGKFNQDRTKLFWLFTQEFVRQRQNASTTQVYARLGEDAARAALEDHGQRMGPMLQAMTGGQG